MKIAKINTTMIGFLLFLLLSYGYGMAEKTSYYAPPTPLLDKKKMNKAKDDYEKKASKSNYKPESDEKAKLLNSLLGDYRLARRIKHHGKTILHKYDAYLQYADIVPFAVAKNVIDKGSNELEVTYDEIWIETDDHLFSEAEKIKYKGKFNINILYWKDNKVQAFTHERLFEGDPYTGIKFKKPSYKIIYIYNREQILEQYSK
jgi:hypothetical protein